MRCPAAGRPRPGPAPPGGREVARQPGPLAARRQSGRARQARGCSLESRRRPGRRCLAAGGLRTRRHSKVAAKAPLLPVEWRTRQQLLLQIQHACAVRSHQLLHADGQRTAAPVAGMNAVRRVSNTCAPRAQGQRTNWRPACTARLALRPRSAPTPGSGGQATPGAQESRGVSARTLRCLSTAQRAGWVLGVTPTRGRTSLFNASLSGASTGTSGATTRRGSSSPADRPPVAASTNTSPL